MGGAAPSVQLSDQPTDRPPSDGLTDRPFDRPTDHGLTLNQNYRMNDQKRNQPACKLTFLPHPNRTDEARRPERHRPRLLPVINSLPPTGSPRPPVTDQSPSDRVTEVDRSLPA